MLVKVKSKVSGVEQCITQKAYNLAKRRYTLLGNCEDGADIYNPDTGTEFQSEVQESPNQTTTAPIASQAAAESGRVAEAVADKSEQPNKTQNKRGPKKQISSPTTVAGV